MVVLSLLVSCNVGVVDLLRAAAELAIEAVGATLADAQTRLAAGRNGRD